jgi:hypothetical protein
MMTMTMTTEDRSAAAPQRVTQGLPRQDVPIGVAESTGIGRELLVRGEVYELWSHGRVVQVVLKVPARTPPAVGAQAATEMGEWVVQNVLQRRSRWLGVVFDVRSGPSIFGPITRAVMERLFEHAERARKPIAVVVGNTASQRDQFSVLARTVAPSQSKITSELDEALAWMTRSGTGGSDGAPPPSASGMGA